MLRRGTVLGLCVIVALAAWVVDLVVLRGLVRQGSSFARVLAFDEALPVLREEDACGWRTDPSRGPADVRTRLVALQFLSGPERGRMTLSCALEPPNPQKRIRWRRGLLVPAAMSSHPNGRVEAVVTRPPLRFGTVIWLAAVPAIVLLAVSATTGLKVIACVAGLWVFGRAFLAGLLAGLPPLPVTVGFSLVVVSGAVLLISGTGRKGLAALAGAAGAVLTTGALAALASRALRITGLESTGARFLLDMTRGGAAAFDFHGLALSGTVIVLLGTACDLSVGIASAVSELCGSTPDMSRRRALESGLAVGRDMGTTMVLTLVFALIGLRLPVFLFPKVAALSPAEVMNSEAGAMEIAQILIASTGLLLTIPLTAVASATLLPGRAMKERPSALASIVAVLRSPGRRGMWAVLAGEMTLGAGLLTAAIILGSLLRVPLPWDSEEDKPSAHLDAGRRMVEDGRPDRALTRLWRARELAPSDTRTHIWLGHACYLMGWPEQAAHEFEMTSKLDPRDPRPLHYLGRLYTEVGRYELAARALESCKLMQPGDPEVVCDLATAYTGLGEWERAVELAERALELEQDFERATAILRAFRGRGAMPPSDARPREE